MMTIFGTNLTSSLFFPPPFACAWGDDRYGLWAEFEVTGRQGVVIQRCRWIEPGCFLMGSPDNEPERSSDETLHEVTLTQGYWLADTACTQALWLAVMGENPSYFRENPENPVERIIWDDAQSFLAKLNALLPGLGAALPTEAQWEYACRAGAQTPFSFGDNIVTEQVNYNGDYPYAGGNPSPYRERTAPVKSFPANKWGLYEMHGNVWEWCVDGYTSYQEGAQNDPLRQTEGALHVLRGGSWGDRASFCRAASRDWRGPVERSRGIGFRMAPYQDRVAGLSAAL